MRPFLPAALCWLLPFYVSAQTPKFQLTQMATNLSGTVDIAHCSDKRLFIVQQNGIIEVIDSIGRHASQPFLDIRSKVRAWGEQGLLGLAFHPNYAQNGWFFVHYSVNPDSSGQISRFTVSATNPNKADPASELKILNIKQPAENHNGGCIKFGPDGKLYIGMGDGGWGGDPFNNGQRPDALLGKMLRIDVDSSTAAQPYKIPPNNPFVGQPGFRPEIWALGLRNPWRFSFDRLTGDMWIGDVGQQTTEEVNFEPAGQSGRNYGWRCFEGALPYNTSGCNQMGRFAHPVFSYGHDGAGGCSIIGGFVYRGGKHPDLYGKYVCTDYCTGNWWVIQRNADGSYTGAVVANLSDSEYTTLGEDAQGELYVSAASQGRIYRLSYAIPVATQTPDDVLGCNISPNPTQDVFELNLHLRQPGTVSAALRNATGQVLATQTQEGAALHMPFDLLEWPAGIYYLHIQTPGGNMVRPVVKW